MGVATVYGCREVCIDFSRDHFVVSAILHLFH